VPVPPKGVGVDEVLRDPRSAMSEAYYSARTALQFSTAAGVPDVLLVTSSKAAEGKSTTSRTIAQNFARLGMRVLLIDADLRNPSLHRSFGADDSTGFSNLLTGAATLDQVVKPTDSPGLFFIPSGPLPPTPAELLGREKLRAVLAEARSMFDLVVLDGPPVLGLADAPLLADAAANVLLVIAARETKRGQARNALRRLQQGQSKVVGVILTKYDARRNAGSYGYGYGYSYDYSYGQQPQLTREVS
jgi:capsular exopolysaccharide synthesis family protein